MFVSCPFVRLSASPQANTLLNTSFEFPTYIRHGSSKNLFENLPAWGEQSTEAMVKPLFGTVKRFSSA